MKTSLTVLAAAALVFATAAPVMADGSVEEGEALAKKCSACHGANGEGKKDNPAIAGMAADAFIAGMQAYRSGEKENKMMNRAAKKLSDDDIEDLAAYYASLK